MLFCVYVFYFSLCRLIYAFFLYKYEYTCGKCDMRLFFEFSNQEVVHRNLCKTNRNILYSYASPYDFRNSRSMTRSLISTSNIGQLLNQRLGSHIQLTSDMSVFLAQRFIPISIAKFHKVLFSYQNTSVNWYDVMA